MSLSAGNVISVVMALAWVRGIYAYWRRDERSKLAARQHRVGREGPAGRAGETEEAAGPEDGQEKTKADPAKSTNQR